MDDPKILFEIPLEAEVQSVGLEFEERGRGSHNGPGVNIFTSGSGTEADEPRGYYDVTLRMSPEELRSLAAACLEAADAIDG